VGHTNKLRAAGQQSVERLHVEMAVWINLNPTKLAAGGIAQHLPRNDVGVVLHHCRHNKVASTNVGPAP